MKNLAKVVLIFFIWIFLEGVFRKWVVPGLATPLFFVKYMLNIIIIVLIIFLIRKGNSYNPLLLPIIFFGIFLLFFAVSSAFMFHPLVGLLGLILYIANTGLVFGVSALVPDVKGVDYFFKGFALICLPVFLLGMYQFALPPTHFLNQYAREMEHIATVGGHVRITSVFSYIGPLQSLIIFTNLIFWSRLLAFRNTNKEQLLYGGLFLLSIICTFMTGSRGSFGWSVLLILVFSLLQLKSFNAIIKLVFITVTLFVFVYLGQFDVVNDSVNAFSSRVEGSNDIEGRLEQSLNPFKFAEVAGPVGYGLGVTYQGVSGFITKRYDMPTYYEAEAERIMLEVGWLGLLIMAAIRLYFFIMSYKLYKSMSSSTLKKFCFAVVIYQVPAVLFFNQVTFNWMANILYWAAIGLVVALWRIDKETVNVQ